MTIATNLRLAVGLALAALTGFHAPQEAARVLGTAADLARQGQLALRDASFKPTVAVVDVPAPQPPPAPPAAAPAK